MPLAKICMIHIWGKKGMNFQKARNCAMESDDHMTYQVTISEMLILDRMVTYFTPLILSELYTETWTDPHNWSVIPIWSQSLTALWGMRLDYKTSLLEHDLHHWLIHKNLMFPLTNCSDFLAICTVRIRKSLRIIETVWYICFLVMLSLCMAV